MADTETRADEPGLVAEPGMKARIDEIEQQMAAHVISTAAPAAVQAQRGVPQSRQPQAQRDRPLFDESDAFARSMADTIIDDSQLDDSDVLAPPRLPSLRLRRLPASLSCACSPALSRYDSTAADTEVEVTEFDHDPELDEAVISYANGDFTQAERPARLA